MAGPRAEKVAVVEEVRSHLEEADAATQLLHFDWHPGGRVPDQIDGVTGFRENLPGREPAARSCESSRPDAAEAELSSRQFAVMYGDHSVLPCGSRIGRRKRLVTPEC